LNGVIGVVGALAKTDLDPRQRDMVGLIKSSGVTLERLVSDILDVSKIEAGRLEIEERVFDLRSELDSLIDLHRARAHEKGLAFRTVFGEAARGDFHGDSTRIKQVLGNLLANAAKFTAKGGIDFLVEVADPAETGQPSTMTFEVLDTGVGFDDEAAAGLFQRFSQADSTITRRFGGTGLGLSICKALVEMMGGEITAQSEPGRGSRFRVSLPIHREQSLFAYDARQADAPGAQAKVELLATGDPDKPLRILLAEDHPINQRVVQLILEPHGVELTVVENGVDALEAHRRGRFDLVLMDMQMPIMDGLAATRAIRRREQTRADQPRTPIIMLSANAMTQHRLEAQAAGADLHVAKPVTAESLIAGVAAALDPKARRESGSAVVSETA
jgi:CheY-like chemotaxis protein